MTSLQDLLPQAGSSNWRKSRGNTDSDNNEDIIVRHIVIREVWLEKRPWPHAVRPYLIVYLLIYNTAI